MDGILLVNKPKGWTSFDVVAKVRGVLRQDGIAKAKVGHTGTLDPLATGLLVLLVGKATKRAPELSSLDKSYDAVLRLGQTSTTGDEEGDKQSLSKIVPSEETILKVLKKFVGEIEQVPPIYSAIKIGGQRAYKLARAGKEIRMEPRRVKIYKLELKNYKHPNLDITVDVSSGTYIRTLAEDIGKKLAVGAYLTELNRTRVGEFLLKDAVDMQKINPEQIYKHLLPLNE